METRPCKTCDQHRPIEDFRLHKGKPRNVCKVCEKEQRRRWYEENFEEIREKSRIKSAEKYAKVRVVRAEERKKRQEALLAEEMARTTKFCSACQQEKPKEEFIQSKAHKYGLHCWCTSCRKMRQAEWAAKNEETLKQKRADRYAANRDLLVDRSKKYHESNKEEINKRRRERYCADPERRQEILETNRQYRKANKKKIRDKDREKERWLLKTDPKFKVDHKMGSAIWGDLKFRGTSKKGKGWQSLAGYTKDDLMVHLQSKFKEGMTWENYGTYWHIDHIIPKSWFKYTSAEDPEFRKCWALENLQPLEAKLNMQKGGFYAGTPNNPITKEELYESNQEVCGLPNGEGGE
jgi:hypothetical protein